jgi:hypothetical protein
MTFITHKPGPELRCRRALPRASIIFISGFFIGLGTGACGQEALPRPQKAPEQYLTPEPKRVFRLESETMLRERMARDSREGNNPVNLQYDIFFPDYPPVLQEAPLARRWEPMTELVDPAFVCYQRLYFQQLNFERYGWDLGIISPILSYGAFYVDLVTLPYHAAMEPLRRYECNTGYYLPGDPAPLLFYLPQPSISGALAEAAVIGLGFVFFP